MKMKEDSQTPIILGWIFPVTTGVMTNVKNGKLSLQVGEEKLKFELAQAISSPTLEDACYLKDVLKRVLIEEMAFLNLPKVPWRIDWLTLLKMRLWSVEIIKGAFMLRY